VMEDALATALIAKLQPILYFIGLFVVLGMVSFGGTIVSVWLKTKEKKEDSVTQALAENTIAIARLDAKFDLFVARHEKDLQGLGNKIRNLEV
jgi:hypothetical protein